jgi:hypothetical protein
VIRAAEAHPVPSRTRSLSPPAPMILPGQPGGNVGHRQKTFFDSPAFPKILIVSLQEIGHRTLEKTWHDCLFDVILVIEL